MSDVWDAPLTDAEQARILPYVTNCDRPVFGLRALPEVVKGALFSRYSRSEQGLRRILLDEFLKGDGAGFTSTLTAPADDAARRRAEAFYERVLIGYGDDSVAELGGAHLACESISNIAAKALESSRIGIAPLEKSTRYVSFAQRIAGRYRYHRDADVMASQHAARYEAACDTLFTTYAQLIEPVSQWVRQRTPRDDATSERAYLSATRARALDLLRGLLPMATLTNVGLYGNGRAFEYLLTKAAASPFAEVRALGSAMHAELDQLIPSFVKRAASQRGVAHAAYLAATRAAGAAAARQIAPVPTATTDTDLVQLVQWDDDAEERVLAAILYPHAGASYTAVLAAVRALDAATRAAVIREYVGPRESRFHKPGRAFEAAYYLFDIVADIGAYRDLQRHRMLTQQQQVYGVSHGYVVPDDLIEAGVAEPYRAALEGAAVAYEAIAADLPMAAQYVVPLAFRVRWSFGLNLREAYHLIELRSGRQGHPGYRQVAQAMYRQIAAVHPTLASGMHFVDLAQYELERLAAEQRIDARLRQRQAD